MVLTTRRSMKNYGLQRKMPFFFGPGDISVMGKKRILELLLAPPLIILVIKVRKPLKIGDKLSQQSLRTHSSSQIRTTGHTDSHVRLIIARKFSGHDRVTQVWVVFCRGSLLCGNAYIVDAFGECSAWWRMQLLHAIICNGAITCNY